MNSKKITSALISVFDKTGLGPLIEVLAANHVAFYSTGGTEAFIRALGHEVNAVEDITGYPSILGGRVKTLHPKVFGGILNRTDIASDKDELETYEIPSFDLVIVDLYPFEKTVAGNATESEIIEKIDIGGIALIRAAAKNFNDVLCISDKDQYTSFIKLYTKASGAPSQEERKEYAVKAFHTSSHYDTAIFNHFNQKEDRLKLSFGPSQVLRYGENPHQEGRFFGPLNELLKHLHGKEISYNNLLDIDAAVSLMHEFYDGKPAFGILKHNNACGFAVRDTLANAYKDALAGDPVSAFGGVLISNKMIDLETASAIHSLFCEVVIAPGYENEALILLKEKKNRIILTQKHAALPGQTIRTCLNGVLVQDKDSKTDQQESLITVTSAQPLPTDIDDLLFASKICKHTKSNTIVLAKNQQLLASGTGQTSRVDALHQAINKAKSFGFNLNGSAMASDAFFPFPDCVEIADNSGIRAIIQPGGSIKDKLSIEYCDAHKIAMVFTGTRHFKH
ncbi:MAG: phosphoribosylaminoimidazolecarboxamide formyltransferase/IMP cyclohydrolase [Flavobacteriaceae bacterium]|jgi:phosphoribosylaminoimidazolecarboxamide formyltransferase/IMP cyclohydrolase|tara:strand:+ start:1027 stop:2550 length:1524 start_codon:yes stop_codon:yes gene_type:complete